MKFRERNYSYPLHHVTVKQIVKLKSGKLDRYIMLYLKQPGADSPLIFKELFKYFAENGDKSLVWQRQVARAVGLFYDYCVVKGSVYKSDNDVADAMRGFVECSLGGDPELGWTPSSVGVVKKNLTYLVMFSRYNSESLGEKLLPKGGITGLQYFYRAYHVKQNVLLSHVTDVKKVASRLQSQSLDHIYRFKSFPSERRIEVFPEDIIDPLFQKGFVLSNGEVDLGSKMLTALLLFGGMRLSEPFHLWFNDFYLYPSTNKLAVFLHHPSEAACNVPPHTKMSRKEYLMQRGLMPRNDRACAKNYRAGWKELAVDNLHRTEIRLIHSKVEAHFMLWWDKYMKIRETCMKSYKEKHGFEHPFFFVKTGDKKDLGAPLSVGAYIKGLKRAIARLEKQGYCVQWGYLDGVSPHPMRHWFMTKLAEHKVSNKVIQKLANHRNILSQEIYKGATARQIDEALSKVSAMFTVNIKE